MEVTMTIKQISVFLENKSGRINDVTKALGKAGINMHAFSMAETTDFGILRLIVSLDILRTVVSGIDRQRVSVFKMQNGFLEQGSAQYIFVRTRTNRIEA